MKLFKIFKLITFISIIIFALSGCKSKNNTSNDNSNNTASVSPTSAVSNTGGTGNTGNTGNSSAGSYKDGTYDIVHKSTKPGYEEAVVTIQGGSIQSIDLKRLDDNKTEVNYDLWNGTGEYPNLKQARIDLANAMLAKQSADVDAISGATQSSDGWKAAVTDALNQAKK
jgi:uncharacterized protein with FMN-binding domain